MLAASSNYGTKQEDVKLLYSFLLSLILEPMAMSVAAARLYATRVVLKLTVYNTHCKTQLLGLLQAAPMQSYPEQERLEPVGQCAPHPGGHGHDCGRSSCCLLPECST